MGERTARGNRAAIYILRAKHGRVILIKEKEAFEAALQQFERNGLRYRDAVRDALADSRDSFKQSLVSECMPSWLEKPPLRMTRIYPKLSPDQVVEGLENLLDEVLNQAFILQPVRCRALYKGITWASVEDVEFKDSLTNAMRKSGVPRREIETLFSAFDAARSGSET